MIAQLRGTLASASDESIVIDVSGVGYEVFVTSGVLGSLPPLDQEIELIISTEVRETSITLYGFRDSLERQVFNLLQKVKGIGARLALGVLSAIGAEKLLACIAKEDVKAITAVPGIGKKTAERVVLELREKVAEFLSSSTLPLSSQITTSVSPQATHSQVDSPSSILDAQLALQKLGFSEQRAREALSAEDPTFATQADSSELLQRALARM